MKVALSVAFALVASASAGSVELTKANFESETAGKNSFIKFQAPW
jgi:hypothetical protein